LLLAPLAQLIIVNRCVTALLLDRRREHGDPAPEEVAPPDVAETEPAPPVQLPASLAAPDLDEMLLRCVRAGQTDRHSPRSRRAPTPMLSRPRASATSARCLRLPR